MSEVKECPKCGGELEKGVMQAPNVVLWNKDEVEENLTSVWGLGRGMLESKVLRRKNCQLIISYYGKETKRF